MHKVSVQFQKRGNQRFILWYLFILTSLKIANGNGVYKATEYELWNSGKYCRPLENVPKTLNKIDCSPFLGKDIGFEGFSADYYHFAPEDPYSIKIRVKPLANFEYNNVAAMDLGFGISGQKTNQPPVPIGRFRGEINCQSDSSDANTQRVLTNDFCLIDKASSFGRFKYAGHNRAEIGLLNETTFYWTVDWNLNQSLPTELLFRFIFINTMKNPPEYCGPVWSPIFRIKTDEIKSIKSTSFSLESANPINCNSLTPQVISISTPKHSLFEMRYNGSTLEEYDFRDEEISKSPFFNYDMARGGPETQWKLDTSVKNTLMVDLPDNIYDGCSVSKGCLSESEECIKAKNCKIAVSWSKQSPYFKFELMAVMPYGHGYVAMGLSKDRQMGDDLIIECIANPNGTTGVYQSWNKRRVNSRLPQSECTSSGRNNGLTNCSVTVSGGRIYCKFLRDKRIVYLDHTIYKHRLFDIYNGQFYLLAVRGDHLAKNNIQLHDLKYMFTSEYPIHFTKVMQQQKKRLVFRYFHSLCMSFCWIVCIPNAMFISRYLKESYTGFNFAHRKIWFIAHMGLAMTGFIITLIGIGMVLKQKLVSESRWPSIKSSIDHVRFGGSAITILMFQVLSGFYRPSGQQGQKTFTVFHFVVGHVVYALGFRNVYASYNLGMPCNVRYIALGVLGWTITCHLLMIYHFVWLDGILGLKKCRALRPWPIKVVLYEDVPGQKQRLRIALIHFIGTVCFEAGIMVNFYYNFDTCKCLEEYCRLSVTV